MSIARILIVEDDIAIRDMLCSVLGAADFDCETAGDIHAAYAEIQQRQPDLILLDWMLPGSSGLELLRRLKRELKPPHIPVIMLTARGGEDHKVTGLDAGADDYISKPFSPRELIARINALLRRSLPPESSDEYSCAGLVLNTASHRSSIDGQAFSLGPKEFSLLQFFMAHEGRVYSRAQILDQVWGEDAYLDERTVDVHIRRLRKALSEGGAASGSTINYADCVQTVRGTGYRFSSENF